MAGSKVISYVHYPIISDDMTKRISSSSSSYNNRQIFAKYSILKYCKLLYYKVFGILYKFCGKSCNLVLCNSSWTLDHINNLWKIKERTFLLYPPISFITFEEFERNSGRKRQIVSISQFRPEKNHEQQLRSFALYCNKFKDDKIKLLICGGCRNERDFDRVRMLQALAKELEILDKVEFKVNVGHEELLQILKESLIGIHTMLDEHFGIGIVEFLASGLIAIANNSAGPKMDIIKKEFGFLCSSDEEYCDAIHKILSLKENQLNSMRTKAKLYAKQKFSLSSFQSDFTSLFNGSVK